MTEAELRQWDDRQRWFSRMGMALWLLQKQGSPVRFWGDELLAFDQEHQCASDPLNQS